MPEGTAPQLLHLVFGGEIADLEGTMFRDLAKVDPVGLFPDYATANAARKSKAQSTVDNAQMRYLSSICIVCSI